MWSLPDAWLEFVSTKLLASRPAPSASRRMASHVLELYNSYFGDTLIYSFSDHKNSGYGVECWASKRSFDRRYVLVVINKTLDTTYTMTIQLEDSIQSYHLRNITNNAPISAPYNGTTGIENQGVFSPDSIQAGWSYLTQTFIPASVSLFEVSTWTGVEETTERKQPEILLPSIVKKGTSFKIPFGTYTLYSITGRKVYKWDKAKTLKIPNISSGVYFLNSNGKMLKKIVVF